VSRIPDAPDSVGDHRPLRESAIVLVAACDVWRLAERLGAWIRLGGILAIMAGIALLTGS